MADYEYGRIKKLADSLTKARIDRNITDQIMAGGELIRKGDKPEKKAQWMKEAMDRMDVLLDVETRRSVREACACCLGGERLKISKQIGKTYKNLDDAIKAANEAKLVFGHSVTTESDGRILVRFFPEDKDSYCCVCLRKAKDPVSETYCYCCGGHVKHHLQIALNRKLSCTIRSSALSSGGKKTCSFLFDIVDED